MDYVKEYVSWKLQNKANNLLEYSKDSLVWVNIPDYLENFKDYLENFKKTKEKEIDPEEYKELLFYEY